MHIIDLCILLKIQWLQDIARIAIEYSLVLTVHHFDQRQDLSLSFINAL